MKGDIFNRREELKQLWIDIFHDSKEYVNLIANTYFVEENIEIFLNDNDDIISALWSVPYLFKSSGKDELMKGLYLCGLSTRESFRGKGIIKNLIKKIENKSSMAGFDFCFLIPADEHLRRYYEKLGYRSLNGKNNIVLKFSNDFKSYLSRFKNEIVVEIKNEVVLKYKNDILEVSGDREDKYTFEFLNITSSEFETFIHKNKEVGLSDFSFCDYEKDLKSIFEFCDNAEKNLLLLNSYRLMHRYEKEQSPLSLLHSPRDFVAAIRENEISGGRVVVMQNSESKPFALLFCYNDEEARQIDVRFCGSISEDKAISALLYLKLCCFQDAREMKIHLFVCSEKENSSLFEYLKSLSVRTSDGVEIPLSRECEAHLENYGMIKWLNREDEDANCQIGEGEIKPHKCKQKISNLNLNISLMLD